MRRRSLSIAAVLVMLAGLLLPALHGQRARAQDGPDIDSLYSMTLEDEQLPPSPVLIRLLRITMDPGSSSPNHTHPGPEMWRVESGTVTVKTQGPTAVIKNGDGKVTAGAVNKEFKLDKGDQVTFPPGTPFTFANKTNDQIKLLVVLVLPQGHQYPPLVTYIDPQPSADAFKGITPSYLGDGRTEYFPGGALTINVDRVRADPGVAIPSVDGPVMLSLNKGKLDFTVAGGLVQVSRSDPSQAGVQPDSAAGTEIKMTRGDAIFFQAGMAEIAHPDNVTALDFFRITVSGGNAAATPVPADEFGSITLTGPAPENTPEAAATPQATEEVTQQPTAKPTKKPTKEATEEPTEEPTVSGTGSFEVGQTVYVNDTSVRLRDAPTTNSNIITGLTLNQELVITGESVDADDITWWPVSSPDGSEFVGWVAEQFLSDQPTE